ncbi:MAG: hypothetical protein DMF59_13600 [Acidobacteria bacterium]|nr:MAG: hypothetical protein DMF59_13600 [Acidobacteriota bacterium]
MERRKRRRNEPHPLATNAKLRTKEAAADRRRKARSEQEKNARITLQLSAELVERLRNIVYWTPGITLTAIVTEALRRCVEERETEHGGAFPKRAQQLRIGRPAK